MANVPIKDCRGYFVLPQAPEQSGYYTYGTPEQGAGQYSHPGLLSLIFMIERRWQEMDSRKFGIGNISMADGPKFRGHKGHKNGLEVDIRPLRKDGRQINVTRLDSQYDRDGTLKLIGLFSQYTSTKIIYFNDLSIPGVRFLAGHDNHFHVSINK